MSNGRFPKTPDPWHEARVASNFGAGYTLRDYLARMAADEEDYDRAEYLERKGAVEFLRKEDPEPDAYGVRAEFLKETDEETRPWGNSEPLNFTPVGDNVSLVSTQLVHVARRRPTTFTILTTLDLGGGWTGEKDLFFQIAYVLGVGQTKLQLLRSIEILVPASGTISAASQLDTVPANAIQVNVTLSIGVIANLGVPHEAVANCLVAPVYA